MDRPGQNGSLPKDSPEHWVPKEVVDECTTALATIGGPTLTCVGVTSCLRDEGRSTIASAVAVVQRFAYGRRTMLVELDMEKPSLAARLGVQSGPGVAGILRGQASVEACLQPIHPDLVLLPAGHVTDTISHTRSLLPTSGLMREVEELCDVAVVDLPPLFSDGMGTHAASLCSTLVLVVRAGTTPMKHIRRAVVALGQPPPIILNRVPKVGPRWLDKMLGGGQ